MLTIKHRLRHLNSESEFLPKEKSEHSTPVVVPIETKSLVIRKKIDQLDENELIEKIQRIEQENENIRRENLLFSRYLRRINNSGIVDKFEEYEDESDVVLIETNEQISTRTKLPDNTRRFSIKRNSGHSAERTAAWTKSSVTWRDHRYSPYFSRVEQERLFIASYEMDQTRLEWERMKINANIILDELNILNRTTESDGIDQEILNRQLREGVDNYRVDISDDEFNSPYLTVSAEFAISRIDKRLKSRTSLISALRLNNTRIYIRMQEINTKLRSLEDLNTKMADIDIDSIYKRKINNIEIYENLNKNYIIKKSSHYPLHKRLQEWEKNLHEQEKIIDDMNRKFELLQNPLDKTTYEIDFIEQENKLVVQQNHFFKNRIDNIKKVPAITDYAHIIAQTKSLQHGIDIWTKRVIIAETSLSQLKMQEKPPHILPPLQLTAAGRHQPFKQANEDVTLPLDFCNGTSLLFASP